MPPSWALAGASGATPPAPPPTGLPTEGLIFWVKGDAGLNSIAGAAVSWEDQSGFGQDVADMPGNPGPFTGLDTIDGIPCCTLPVANGPGRGLYRPSPSPGGLRDRNGVVMGYGPGETQSKTVMAMILPRTWPGQIGFLPVTGGIVAELGGTPNWQPVFDLEDNSFPNAFYAFSDGWRNTGFPGANRAPDALSTLYSDVPTLAMWSSSGFDDLSFAANGGALALTPLVMPGAPAAGVSSFAVLRAISGGLNFFGACPEISIWDWQLGPAELAQATAYYAGRYPSAPIV